MIKAKILIVDDEPNILRTLEQVLSPVYDVDTAENGVQGIARLQEKEYELLLTDLKMPDVDGVQLMDWSKRLYPNTEVIMVTGFSDISLAVKIVRKGAYTYLTKPFRIADIQLNVQRALEKRQSELDRKILLQKHRDLEDQLLRAQERQALQEEVIFQEIAALLKALEGKDSTTGNHAERVAILAREFAKHLRLSSEEQINIERSGRLHDIGKIGIVDRVLQKPGRLTDKEYAEIKTHPRLGAEIIRPISFLHSTLEGIAHHHEAFDGSGYPDGLRGKEIPYVARILAVVESFDAMTSPRAYRTQFNKEMAIQELFRCSGLPFDQEKIFIDCKKNFYGQLLWRRKQAEKQFLARRIFGGISDSLSQTLASDLEDSQELQELLGQNRLLAQEYTALQDSFDEIALLVQDCANHEENVFSKMGARLKNYTGRTPFAELEEFLDAIQKEMQFCLIQWMQPRLQFDPEVVTAFVDYLRSV